MTDTSTFFATTDLCDAHEALFAEGSLHVLPPLYRAYGGRTRFCGPLQTVRCFEDNSLVRTALEAKGDGRVLLVDGAGSLRCALLGGNLAQLAERNGWAGVIVHGCVRDVREIDVCAIGVRALASHPRRSEKRGTGVIGELVEISGILIAPGHWCYVDENGILVSTTQLSTQDGEGR